MPENNTINTIREEEERGELRETDTSTKSDVDENTVRFVETIIIEKVV